MARNQKQKPIRSKKNPIEWHGHRIVTENDLDTVFADDGNVERPHIYMRRLRHGVVLVLLVGLLTAAVLFALALARGDIQLTTTTATPSATPTDTCPSGPYELVDPPTVTVNVLNSTSIEGLAGNASASLEERGFVIEAVGNRTVEGSNMTATIVSGPAGYAQAFTLQRTIPGTYYVEDDRSDTTVDVVLGSEFEALVPAEEVNPEAGGLTCQPPATASATPSAAPASDAP